jgi:hypothetical protein
MSHDAMTHEQSKAQEAELARLTEEYIFGASDWWARSTPEERAQRILEEANAHPSTRDALDSILEWANLTEAQWLEQRRADTRQGATP